MLQAAGHALLGLSILNDFLEPIAASQRCKRFLKKFGFEIRPLQVGTLILSPEEFDQLERMGALPIILKGKERFQEMREFVKNLKDWET